MGTGQLVTFRRNLRHHIEEKPRTPWRLGAIFVSILVALAQQPLLAADAIVPNPTSSGSKDLQWIDWVLIVIYASATIGMGWYYGRKQQSTSEYFIGSGKMNPLLVGVSLFATLSSTISYLAIPGEAIGKGPVVLVNIIAYPFIF